MSVNKTYQRGVSLSGLLVTVVIIALVALLGLKVAPEVIQYLKVVQAIKAVSSDPSLKGASVTDVRKAYERRAIIDAIDAIGPQDIDVTKDGNDLVLSFSYEKRIPLFSRVSLLIDFEGSTAK